MDVNIVKKNIEEKIEKIDDENLKKALLEIFSNLIKKVDVELVDIKNSVSNEIQSIQKNLYNSSNIDIFQKYFRFNEKISLGFNQMYDFNFDIKSLDLNGSKFKVTFNSELEFIKVPILLINQNFDISTINSKFKITPLDHFSVKNLSIKRDNSIIELIDNLKTLFIKNRLELKPPYLPYSLKLYYININIDKTENLPKNIEFEIEFQNSDSYIVFPKIAWNIKIFEKDSPKTKTKRIDWIDYLSYSIEHQPKSKLLFESESVKNDTETETETAVLKNIDSDENYNYYEIFYHDSKNIDSSIKSNSFNDRVYLPKSSIKTKFDFESYFSSFKDISGLKLVDIVFDGRLYEISDIESAYYRKPTDLDYSEKRATVTLKVKSEIDDHFAKEKLLYLCSIIEERTPLFWIKGEFVNE